MNQLRSVFFLIVLFLITAPVLAQSGNNCQVFVQFDSCYQRVTPGYQWTLSIYIDMTSAPAPDTLLGSFTGVLNFDSTLVKITSFSAIQGGLLGFANAGADSLRFNGISPNGVAGKIKVIDVDFEAIGEIGTDGVLDLDILAVTAAQTFNDLLPVLCVDDCYYKIASTTSVPAQISEQSIHSFRLLQNHPNPFNPSTALEYELAQPTRVRLSVINLQGQIIRQLVDSIQDAGSHVVRWNGKDDFGNLMPTGIYLYRFMGSDFLDTKKMLLIR